MGSLQTQSQYNSSGRRSLTLDPFEEECVEFFAEVVHALGVPRSVGQIYGLLYASPTPLSFTDILTQLNASKGSVSQGLQLLRTLGAVSAVAGPEERREYFKPELSLRRLVSGVFRERISPLAGMSVKRLDRLRQISISQGGDKFRLKQVKQLETWRRKLRITLPLIMTLLGSQKN